MASTDLVSIAWFSVYMRISNEGLTPTVSPTTHFPKKRELAAFWNGRSGAGYVFHNFGDIDYEDYVHELFKRVLQLEWPISGLLPFHFARGVMAEAMARDINWCEFAYKQTHPHQSRSGIPRVLPEYKQLRVPLRRLKKVVPKPFSEVCESSRITWWKLIFVSDIIIFLSL